jgi:hypothetical protein
MGRWVQLTCCLTSALIAALACAGGVQAYGVDGGRHAAGSLLPRPPPAAGHPHPVPGGSRTMT